MKSCATCYFNTNNSVCKIIKRLDGIFSPDEFLCNQHVPRSGKTWDGDELKTVPLFKIRQFFRKIEHGDDKHRTWLMNEFNSRLGTDIKNITPSGKESGCTACEKLVKSLKRIQTAGSRQLARQFAREALNAFED